MNDRKSFFRVGLSIVVVLLVVRIFDAAVGVVASIDNPQRAERKAPNS